MQSINKFIKTKLGGATPTPESNPTIAKPGDGKHPLTSSVAPGRPSDAKTGALGYGPEQASSEDAVEAPSIGERGAAIGATEDQLAQFSDFGRLARGLLDGGGRDAAERGKLFDKLLASAAEHGTPATFHRDAEAHRALEATRDKLKKLPAASALSAEDQAKASATISKKLSASTERMNQHAGFTRQRERLARDLTNEVVNQVSTGQLSDEEAGSMLGSIARHLIEGGPRGHEAVKAWAVEILQDSRLAGSLGMNRVRDMTKALVVAVATVLCARDPKKPIDAARKEAAGQLKELFPDPRAQSGGGVGPYDSSLFLESHKARETILRTLLAEISPQSRSRWE